MQPQHVVDKVSDDTAITLDGRPNDYATHVQMPPTALLAMLCSGGEK